MDGSRLAFTLFIFNSTNKVFEGMEYFRSLEDAMEGQSYYSKLGILCYVQPSVYPDPLER